MAHREKRPGCFDMGHLLLQAALDDPQRGQGTLLVELDVFLPLRAIRDLTYLSPPFC